MGRTKGGTGIKNHRRRNSEVIVSRGTDRPVLSEMTSHSENQVTPVRLRNPGQPCLLNQNFPHGMCPRNRNLPASPLVLAATFRRPFSLSGRSWPSSFDEFRASHRNERDTGRRRSGRQVWKQSVKSATPRNVACSPAKWRNKRR